MISKMFGYTGKFVENVQNFYTAFKHSDIKTIQQCQTDFAKETVAGIGKVAIRAVGGEVISAIAEGSYLEGAVSVATAMSDQKIIAATVAGNAIGCLLATAVIVPVTLKENGEIYRTIRNNTLVQKER